MKPLAALAIGIAFTIAGNAASAADLSAPRPVPVPPILTAAGLYVAGAAGFNWNRLSNKVPQVSPGVSLGALVAPTFMHMSTDTGFSGVASVGWAFGNGFRVEAEYGHRSNDVSSFFATYGFPVTYDIKRGSIDSNSVMANVLYDVGATMGWPVHITVGGGIGYSQLSYRNVTMRARDGVGGYQTIRLNDEAGGFAWQGIVGLSYPIAAIPGLSLTADYRYFATAPRHVKGTIQQGAISQAGVVGATVATGTLRRKSDYSNHSLMIGLRYVFGQGSQL